MSPTDMALALMLLSAPVGTPEPPITQQRLDEIRPALRLATRELRLGESDTQFLSPAMYQFDLDDWRQERERLADAPDLPDLARLPDAGTARRAVEVCDTFKEQLLGRRRYELDLAFQLDEAAREVSRAREAYYLLACARSEGCNLWNRRLNLKRIRELIGPEAFAAGHMPDPIPRWCSFEVHLSAAPVKLVPDPEPAPLPRPR